MQLSQHEHQSTSVSSTSDVCPALRSWNLDTSGCRHIGTLGAFHMKCQRQMLNIHWWDHTTNAEVYSRKQACQQSAKSYATVACLFSAMLHVWTLKSQQTRSCSWWWTVTRAGSHRKAGPDLRAVLAAPGSTLYRRKEDANAILLSSLWRTEIFSGHGATQVGIF